MEVLPWCRRPELRAAKRGSTPGCDGDSDSNGQDGPSGTGGGGDGGDRSGGDEGEMMAARAMIAVIVVEKLGLTTVKKSS